jgi:hypothetical protein
MKYLYMIKLILLNANSDMLETMYNKNIVIIKLIFIKETSFYFYIWVIQHQ